jgi:hypothetical protein
MEVESSVDRLLEALRALGSGAAEALAELDLVEFPPATAWARSGAMWLSGTPNGPPAVAPGSLANTAEGCAAAIGRLSAAFGHPVQIHIPTVLSGRAAIHGRTRAGRVSVGGRTRLLATGRGWIAVTLARPADRDLLPALLERPAVENPWSELAAFAQTLDGEDLENRAQLLGIAAAMAGSRSADLPWRTSIGGRPRRTTEPPRLPTVVDLSSLWAGPLCASILSRAGARVIKVESTRRPDPVRMAEPLFFAWLHCGHQSVAIDLSSASGAKRLRSILELADVVIEASRPRALQQLGVCAADFLRRRPGRTWISITGYGRNGESGRRVGFGDDAAAAGGLLGSTPGGGPVFCGDAIADPLTGLFAGAAALGSQLAGGGHLLDVPLADAAAFAGSGPQGPPYRTFEHPVLGVALEQAGTTVAVSRPRAPRPRGQARPLGSDTVRVLAEAC